MKEVIYNVAHDSIRKRILSGEFPPGSPLMANSLAGEIGLSRTSIREALRQLEVEGLVEIRPHLGASVKTMDLVELQELCELRLALESRAAGLAARNRTSRDLQEIKRALEAMRTLTDRILEASEHDEHFNELMREDVRFHIAIISAGKNKLMKNEILRLHLINRIVTGRFPSRAQPGGDEDKDDAWRKRCRTWMVSHEAIYEAIARQDVVRARSEMEDHIQGIIDNGLQQIADSEDGAGGHRLTEDEAIYIN